MPQRDDSIIVAGSVSPTAEAMVGQYGIKLAANIIQAHFGNIVSKVCECLLRRGTLTLSEILHFTELTQQEVRDSLIVLIQHNCVQPFIFKNEVDEENVPKGTHYTIIFENILHRLRFSKFLNIVSEQLDKEGLDFYNAPVQQESYDEKCLKLLQGLLQHGRLTLEQIILRAISKRKEGEGDCAFQDTVRDNFEKLVNAHYVERCPKAESIVNINDAGKKKKPGKKGSKSNEFVAPETLEHQAITAAIPSERFVVIKNTGTDVNSEANTSEKPHNVAAGEKRKADALEKDDRTDAMICEKEVLWRANFDEFVCHLRHKACIESVRSQYDNGAAIILEAMLEKTRNIERKVKIESTVPLSSDAILGEVKKHEDGHKLTIYEVEGVLGQLGCHSSTIGTEELYTVDIKNIIEIAQNDEVESLVSKRYGKDAYKMFRLLSKKDKLIETDKISDTAFVEKMEALKLLNNLWKDDYLYKEKVTTNPAGQSHFFLWKVNKRWVRGNVFDEMCHAALNLRLRLAYELEQEREILELPVDKRVGAQGKRYERIKKVNILLESSLIKLDGALLLFHDF